MHAPEDEGLESERPPGDEPPDGSAAVDQAPLGEGAHPLPRAAQGPMQPRARVLAQPRAGTSHTSSREESSEDGEEPGAQAGRGQGGARDDAVERFGVTYDARRPHAPSPYVARIKWQGHEYRLGAPPFPDAVSAAKAYDWAARLVGKKRQLNFGREVDLGTPPATDPAALLRARVSQAGGPAALERAAEARYLGVLNAASPTNPFRAQIRGHHGRMYHLGGFPDALAAAKAHDWATRLIDDGRPLNFDASDDLGAPPTTSGAAQLRRDVAAAAAQATRRLGSGAALRSAARMPTLASATLPAQQRQQQRMPARAAGAAAKRPALAAPAAGPPPAAKKRRAPPEPQPTPRDEDASAPAESGLLACQLRVLLRLRGLREDDLALDELGEGALRDITADVRHAERVQLDAVASLAGYSALDLQARLAVNMRLRFISEDGVHLDLLTVAGSVGAAIGRRMLLDVLRIIRPSY